MSLGGVGGWDFQLEGPAREILEELFAALLAARPQDLKHSEEVSKTNV
jgi:hypothetical protein